METTLKNTTIEKLKNAKTYLEKNLVLDREKKVYDFFSENQKINFLLEQLSQDEEYILKLMVLINQEHILFCQEEIDLLKKLKALSDRLLEIEKFYSPIGGIVGYHNTFMYLLKKINSKNENVKYLKPEAINIEKKDFLTQSLIDEGLKNLDRIALICPMGGAGERLNLVNKKTKQPLPVAKLNFMGKTLLQNIIEDIQSLEYLYYKNFNKEILTPIVIMTSDARHNHIEIHKILEKNSWFNRSKESFFFIKQPSVPLIAENGLWALNSPLSLALKPSGHGAIWKLMKEKKGFDFLKKHSRTKALIRQINNPIANCDYTLLAFIGAGFRDDKKFGFATCPQDPDCQEGVVVLKETKVKDRFLYNYSNIEYTDFYKNDLLNELSNDFKNHLFTNTNILFADINEMEEVVEKDPFPGLMINLKSTVYTTDENNKFSKIKAGRLESMMQNISDSILDEKKEQLKENDQKELKSFITFSTRSKTISPIKKAYQLGKPLGETPIGAYFDLLKNYVDLLKNSCHMKLPDFQELQHFLLKGPSIVININPILGPLYSVISQKIIGGEIIRGSEMQLEIAELMLDNIYLNGSLIIKAPLKNETNFINHKCELKNVIINNEGIDFSYNNIFYQNEIRRNGYLKIILNDESEFYAKNIVFKQSEEIVVPPKCRMFAFEKDNKIIYKIQKI